MIQECKNRPADMSVKQWCDEHSITVANYYYLTSMCLSTVGSIGPAISTYYAGDYNTESVDAFIQTWNEALPDNENVAFNEK